VAGVVPVLETEPIKGQFDARGHKAPDGDPPRTISQLSLLSIRG
jgi:hypothetical protein